MIFVEISALKFIFSQKISLLIVNLQRNHHFCVLSVGNLEKKIRKTLV